MREAVIPLLAILLVAQYLTPYYLAKIIPSALPEEIGPFEFDKYYWVIFWIPCASAGEEGVVVRMVYPKEPRYPGGAPVVVYVSGGIKPGFLGFYDPKWDPHGVIWINFIFPGGSETIRLPTGETRQVKSGGTYDYRGFACLEALYAVLQFAQGKLSNGVGKKIMNYVDYKVLTDNVGMYGSSYGGVTAALVFAKYNSGLEGVKYIVFYESPATNFLAVTDLGRVGDDPKPDVDDDGDGLPWNDYRNPNYVIGSTTEEGCEMNFSRLSFDPDVGFYLDNDGDGKPTYFVKGFKKITDVDNSGAIEPDEDFIFTPWQVVLKGTKKNVYSYLVIKAAHEKGLLKNLPPHIMGLEETYNFWYWRDMSFHYDEIVKNAPWLKVMQLGFLKEHMCPAPDYPNVVLNYNAFKKRGIWVRLNPDKCYLEYVTGRTVEWEDNDANMELNFINARNYMLSDWKLNFEERKLIELASVLEMADRVYYNDWSPNLNKVLTEVLPAPVMVKRLVVEGEWVHVGPDGGDNYFVFVTSKHTVITSTANSAFRSTDGAKTWEDILNDEILDLGFVSMAEADGVLFAGLGKGRGLVMSKDDGKTWIRVPLGVSELEGQGDPETLCEIRSIVALSSKHIYLGVKSLHPKGKKITYIYEAIFDEVSNEWKVIKHELPEKHPLIGVKEVVYRLDYDPNFKGMGPTLFVSKYPFGLYMVTNLDGEWKWTKILDKKTTAVCVAKDIDVVYVGTYDDWIYRGEYDGTKWKWTRLNPLEGVDRPPKLPMTPVISDVVIDPYNPNRVWWGTPGRLVRIYSIPEGQKCIFGVFAWDPKTKKWLHSFVTEGWGAFIAVDKHAPGEDESGYVVYIDGVKGAKIAYTCSYSFKCLLKTTDGGRVWRPSYEGIYGDCMNAISFLSRDPHPHTFVALCQSGIELSYDYGKTWEDYFDLSPGGVRMGFPWYALPLPEEFGYTVTIDGKTYTLDLLILAAYPGPEPSKGEKKYGMFAISTAYIKEAKRTGKSLAKGAVRLTENPTIYGIIVDRYAVLVLQEGGVEVYDFVTRQSFVSSKGLPESGGTCAIAQVKLKGVRWWVVATYEGEPLYKGSWGNDHYFWFGPSRLYRAKNLLLNREDTVWEQIYPPYGKTEAGIVSVRLLSSGELLALESSGKLVYCSDITAEELVIKVLELTPSRGGMPSQFTDMEVDENRGIIYVSSVGHEGLGVYYVLLKDVREKESSVTCYPLGKGLHTRLVRSLAITPDGKYLFAGTWWSSSWRIEPKVREVELAGEVNLVIPSEAYVGSEFMIKVIVLELDGEPLANVKVKIYINGKLLAEGMTNSEGVFEAKLIPSEVGTLEILVESDVGTARGTLEVKEAVLKLISPYPNTQVFTVNNQLLTTDANGVVEVKGAGEYTVEAKEVINLGPKKRGVFVKWSTGETSLKITIEVRGLVTLTAIYKTQYYLKIVSEYGSPKGEGWHDEGEVIHVSVQPMHYINFFQRAVFVGWTGSLTSSSPEVDVLMDSPKLLIANWKVEYDVFRLVMILAIVLIALVIYVLIKKR